MLMYDGYTFIREKNGVNDKLIWRCLEWSKTKCKGHSHTDLEEVKLAFVPVEDVILTYEIILHRRFYTENMPISSSFCNITKKRGYESK